MQSANPNPHEPTSEPSFDESSIIKNPIGQFKIWYDQASAHPDIREANVMIVSTCTKDGIPSARPLLLKVKKPSNLFVFLLVREVDMKVL